MATAKALIGGKVTELFTAKEYHHSVAQTRKGALVSETTSKPLKFFTPEQATQHRILSIRKVTYSL
ncbi:hypothetical protein P3TCK_05571 [Photobacterium profundum 3TCK]|uniref:Uncharacterized protein n=1 Tax=Photobacterium profundum 3TCK TaxID=314280 RepID=Q1Z9M1_9GAMM|nr:hypothetical protein P3TCK_05571 [Photobacterium profundum 3TCK]